MPGRIEELTPGQEARLAELRDEWEAAALAAEPADRPRAEHGMRAAYVAAGLPPPTRFLWARSPLEGALAAAHLGVAAGDPQPGARRERQAGALQAAYQDLLSWPGGGEAWGGAWAPFAPDARDPLGHYLAHAALGSRAVRDHVGTRLPRRVGRRTRALVGSGVGQHIRTELELEVRERVVNQVWFPLAADIQARAWPRLKAYLDERHGDRWAWLRAWSVIRDLYGLVPVQDLLHAPLRDRGRPDWLAVCDFLGRVCGLEVVDCMGGLMEVARSAGWWWPHRAAVVLCERPVRLLRDERGRLHSGQGPAVQYPDGWAVWAWHGVRVPRRVIERPEGLDAREVLAEPDVDVRRVMIARLGNDRFLRDAGARRVGEDEAGILWRLDLPNDEPMVCVEVTDATPGPDATFRRYVLRVPPDVRTPREAVAWTFGVDPREYRPAVES